MLDEAPPNSVVIYVGVIFLAGFYFLIHSLVTQAFRLPRGGKLSPWQLKPVDFDVNCFAVNFGLLPPQLVPGKACCTDHQL